MCSSKFSWLQTAFTMGAFGPQPQDAAPQLRPRHKCGGQIVRHTFGKLRHQK
uniref:Uncharacterized protein n=1 Tax=Arundo donax TaxID=35708 RepID=A0A0A9CKD0_ARUDO